MYKVLFEYSDGSITEALTSTLVFKGIRKGTERPSYMTIICNKTEEEYHIQPTTAAELDMLTYVVRGDSSLYGRVTLKPYWFHKLIHKQG